MLTDAEFAEPKFLAWTGYRTSSFTQGGLVTARKPLTDAERGRGEKVDLPHASAR